MKHLLKRRKKQYQSNKLSPVGFQDRISALIRDNQQLAASKHSKGSRDWWTTVNAITGMNDQQRPTVRLSDYTVVISDGTKVPELSVYAVTEILDKMK